MKRIHFAEELNEYNHLLIMESLGGDQVEDFSTLDDLLITGILRSILIIEMVDKSSRTTCCDCLFLRPRDPMAFIAIPCLQFQRVDRGSRCGHVQAVCRIQQGPAGDYARTVGRKEILR